MLWTALFGIGGDAGACCVWATWRLERATVWLCSLLEECESGVSDHWKLEWTSMFVDDGIILSNQILKDILYLDN
jgi:hypothetical protein